jgi:predicted PurR-regulated permease PerM
VLAYFLDVEGPSIVRRVLLLVPGRHREQVRTSMVEVDAKLGAYFRGQALLSLVVGAFTTAGYFLIGLPFALALGLFMSVMEAVPLIGPVIGAIPAILVAATMSPNDIIWVIVVIAVVQVLEGNFLVPKIMGESVGVHPIVMILAIAAFGAIFGIVGVIVAVPLAATVQVIVHRYLDATPLSNGSRSSDGEVTDRGALGALRFKTQELYEDLRRSSRSTRDADQGASEAAEWEDELESIAVDLDSVLQDMDQKE